MTSSTEIESPKSMAEESPATRAEKQAGESCASGTCMFSNYRTLAFMIPFLAVTGYSLSQGATCAATGEHACAASAVAVGALAGLTSLGLVTAIKSLKRKAAQKA